MVDVLKDTWLHGIHIAMKPTFLNMQRSIQNMTFEDIMIDGHLNFDCLENLLG